MCVPGTDAPSASLRSLGFFFEWMITTQRMWRHCFSCLMSHHHPLKVPGKKGGNLARDPHLSSQLLPRKKRERPARSQAVWECQISNSVSHSALCNAGDLPQTPGGRSVHCLQLGHCQSLSRHFPTAWLQLGKPDPPVHSYSQDQLSPTDPQGWPCRWHPPSDHLQ